MPKKFAFSDDGSRYHTLKYHNRRFWGRPVYKAVVDAGFTCPNIDGSCGVGGCVYCSGGSGLLHGTGAFRAGADPSRDGAYPCGSPGSGDNRVFSGAHEHLRYARPAAGGLLRGSGMRNLRHSTSRPEPTVSTVSAQSSSPRWAFRSRWSLGSRPRMTPPRGSSTAGTISRGSQRASTPPGMPDCVSAYT